MNSTKKILAVILAMMMLVSAFELPASAAPSAPSKVTATQNTTAIKLSWTKVSGATGYRIYYKLPGDISWRTALKSTASTSHTFKNLPEGQHYTFAVRSYVKSGNKVTWGSYKEIRTATQTAAPKKLTAAQNETAIKLSWSEVKGATGYRIYYRATSTKSWKVIVSATDDTTHTFKNISPAKKYDFAVRPYIKTSSAVIWSDYKTISTATKPEKPSNFKAVADYKNKTVTLSWNKVTRADGYRIYYKKTNDSTWKLLLNSTTATKCTVKNVPQNYYNFAVLAFVKTTSGTITGAYNQIFVSTITPTYTTTNSLVYTTTGGTITAPTVVTSKTQTTTWATIATTTTTAKTTTKPTTKATTTTRPTTTAKPNPVAMKVSIIEVGMDAQERFYAAIDSAGWGGSFKANSGRVTVYVDGVPMDEQVMLQISSSTTGDGYQYVYLNLADYGIDPSSSTISFEIPEGFLENKTGTKYNYSAEISS